MNRERLYALLATLIASAIVIAALMLCAIRFDRTTLPVPPRLTTGIVQEEEFAELYTPAPQELRAETASPTLNPIAENNDATPAPQTGTDTENTGDAGEAITPKSSSRPSPLKQKTDEPKKKGPGPAQDADKKKQDEAKRKASADLKNAFANTKGNNNTRNQGKNKGNAGSHSGASDSEQHGRGSGRVNGGWKMPAYAKVPSTVTGTIEIKATINREGKVTAVEVIGGQAPAATNTALTNACKDEVRRRIFTRSDKNPPETATAYITYKFN
jgi:hypothetical protein